MNKENKPLLHSDHPRPVTRRELLGQGFISFSATLMAPSVLGMLFQSSRSLAAGMTCGTAATMKKSMVPFLVFDMAGGAALPGNFLAGKKGGPEDLLASYDTLGWDPRGNNAVDKRFGLPMAGNNVSKIFQGITQFASQGAQANLRMGSFCHFSQDDTRSNQMSALTLASKGGFSGTVIPQGLGMENTLSGGNSDAVLKDLNFKPLAVTSVDDVKNSLTFGQAFSDFTPDEIIKMQKVAASLTAEQAKDLSGLNRGDQLGALAACAFERNPQYAKPFEGADPRLDEKFRRIYNLFPGSNARGQDVISATIVMNALKGQSGPGAIIVGGCDYHTNNQTTGDQKDLEMGQHIGRAVEAAFQMKTPLFFQLLTDGGCSASTGTRNWSSDSGVRGMTVIGFYDPTKPPKNRRFQVGQYTDGQVVDQSSIIGGEPAKVGYAVFANYMNACGLLGEFTNVVGRSAIPMNQLDDVLIFE